MTGAAIALLVVRVLAGGAIVVAFAMLSDLLKPKMFAGLFGGAPSVASMSLLVTGLSMGPARAESYAMGMMVGAAGLVAYCATATLLVNHLGAIAGSIISWGAWLIVAIGLFWLFLR